MYTKYVFVRNSCETVTLVAGRSSSGHSSQDARLRTLSLSHLDSCQNSCLKKETFSTVSYKKGLSIGRWANCFWGDIIDVQLTQSFTGCLLENTTTERQARHCTGCCEKLSMLQLSAMLAPRDKSWEETLLSIENDGFGPTRWRGQWSTISNLTENCLFKIKQNLLIANYSGI